MTPQQLETYTAKQIYDFGETDLEKYVKTNAGEFGTAGDVYLHANDRAGLARLLAYGARGPIALERLGPCPTAG